MCLGRILETNLSRLPGTPVGPTASLRAPVGPATPLRRTLLSGLGVHAECSARPARTSGVNTGLPWPGSQETWGSVPSGFGAGKCEDLDFLNKTQDIVVRQWWTEV